MLVVTQEFGPVLVQDNNHAAKQSPTKIDWTAAGKLQLDPEDIKKVQDHQRKSRACKCTPCQARLFGGSVDNDADLTRLEKLSNDAKMMNAVIANAGLALEMSSLAPTIIASGLTCVCLGVSLAVCLVSPFAYSDGSLLPPSHAQPHSLRVGS